MCDSILLKMSKNLIFAWLNLLLDSRTFCVTAQEEQFVLEPRLLRVWYNWHNIGTSAMFFTVSDLLRADRNQQLLLNLLNIFSQFLMGIVILGCKVILWNKTCNLYQCLKCLTYFYMKSIKWKRQEQSPFSCLVGKYIAFRFNCSSCRQLF